MILLYMQLYTMLLRRTWKKEREDCNRYSNPGLVHRQIITGLIGLIHTKINNYIAFHSTSQSMYRDT